MKKIWTRGLLTLVLLFSATSQVWAAPAWYYGKITRLSLYSDGFIVTFDTTALDDCQYKYVYFKANVLGDKTVDRAMSIILAAQASEKTVGVVIDKSINGAGGQCSCTGSMDIKD